MSAAPMVEVPAPRLSRPVVWSLAVILVVAAAVRLWGIDFGLPFGYARPDETYVMDVVVPILRGERPAPHYEYPWVYMWLTAVGYLGYYAVGSMAGVFATFADFTASWKTHYEPFFLVNRGISALAGTLTVLLVFRIGRRLWDDRAGLIAAVCLALAYLHVRDSHYGTTDVTMTLFVVWSVLLLLDAHERGGWHRYALAGLTGGLAAATKYNAALVGLPVLVSLAGFVMEPGVGRIKEAGRRLVAYGTLFALGGAIGVPFVLMDPGGFAEKIQALVFSTATGQAHQDAAPGWLTHLRFSLRYGLGVAMLGASFVGIAVMAVRDGVRGWLVLAFPLTYFAVMGAAANQYYRYMVPVVPFLCVAAAGVVHHLLTIAHRSQVAPRRGLAVVAPAALAAVLVAEPAWRSLQYDRALTATDNRVVVADWIAENVPPGSSLLVTGSHYGHPWLPADRGYRMWVWDQADRRYWLPGEDDDRPDWVLRQEHPLSADRAEVAELLADSYAVAWRFAAARTSGRAPVYDRMDAFYLPYSSFSGVSRPGPSFTLFRRIR